MKTDIIKILSKRAEHFEKIHHSLEAIEIKSAIDTIVRLMPPELFSIPVVRISLPTEQDCINAIANQVKEKGFKVIKVTNGNEA